MALPLPPERLRYWRDEAGYRQVLDILFVSNLLTADLADLAPLLSPPLDGDCELQIVKVDHNEPNPQAWITPFFDGALQVRLDTRIRTMSGSYLRMLVPHHTENTEQAKRRAAHAANLVRMRFGFASALEVADEVGHDLRTGAFSHTTDGYLVAMAGDGRAGNPLFENDVVVRNFMSQHINLNPEASVLLEASVQTHHAGSRFLLLWMALETQIGDGKARRRFCEIELRSTVISEEMARLHALRSDLVHDGETNGLAACCVRLVDLVRLSALPSGIVRDELARLFEASLS